MGAFASAAISLIAKLAIFTWVSQAAFRFAIGVLSWVTSPNFLAGVSYTRNEFVTTGWQIVRDFCNSFYILVVIAIGIGTALRIREYQIKKLLPKLIISALLINFTPVICGVIIDASNILMNTFLQGGGSAGLSEIVIQSVNSVGEILGRMFHLGTTLATLHFARAGDLIFDSLVTIIFNFYGTFVVLALALLFMMRYIALWTAVILAPLAFLCWVLPPLTRFWKMWWRQFISWCLVGIGGAFFLYLGGFMARIIQNLISTPGGALGLSTQGLSGVLVHLFPLTFVFIGYTLTLQFAPMGASMVLGLVKMAQGYVAGKIIGRYGKPELQRWRKLFSRPPMPQKLGRKMAEWKAVEPRELPKQIPRPLRWMAAWSLRKVAGVSEKLFAPSREELKNLQDAYKQASEQDLFANLALLREFLREQSEAAAAGVIKAMAEKGQIFDAMKKEKAGVAAIGEEELMKLYKYAKGLDYHFGTKTAEPIEQAFLHNKEMLKKLASSLDEVTKTFKPEDRTKGGLTEKEKRLYETFEEMLRAKHLTKRERFEELEKSLQKMPEEKRREVYQEIYNMFKKGLLKRELFAQAGRVFGNEFISLLESELERPEELYQINPKTGRSASWMVKWAATSPAARELGIMVPQEFMNEAQRRRYETISTQATKLFREFTLQNPYQSLRALRDKIAEYLKQAKEAENVGDVEKAKSLRRQAKILRSTFSAIEEKAKQEIEQLNLDQLRQVRNKLDIAFQQPYARTGDVYRTLQSMSIDVESAREKLRRKLSEAEFITKARKKGLPVEPEEKK